MTGSRGSVLSPTARPGIPVWPAATGLLPSAFVVGDRWPFITTGGPGGEAALAGAGVRG